MDIGHEKSGTQGAFSHTRPLLINRTIAFYQ